MRYKPQLDYGIRCFLSTKKVDESAVQSFIASVGEKPMKKDKASRYINANWVKFASFIDKGIKSGTIKGKDVKLNTYFDEKRERNKQVSEEFKNIDLTKDEIFIINRDFYDFSEIHSFINKKGFPTPPKDTSYTSKKLSNMPIIHLLRKHDLVDEMIEYLKSIGK